MQPFVLIAQLWIAPGRREDFERFESAASEIMRRHGGRIERRIALRKGAAAGSPDEIHVVTFPSEPAFQAYREDHELALLAELRARAILRTVIWEGNDQPPFDG